MSDDGERTCPLCAEEMDLTDQQLKPCKCGYEICVWCWHHIIDMAEKDDTEGRCPACRTPYDKERIVGMTANCGRVVAEVNAEKKQKTQKAKPKTSVEAKKHLNSVRVIQRNLVYIIGLPLGLADESLLERREYFGQYGRVLKVSISRPTGGPQQTSNCNTFSVYITYAKEEEAVRCIQAVHSFVLDGKPLRACFGTTKYCRAWLRNMACNNPDCLYLHDVGCQEDSFTKDEIISAYTRNRVPAISSSNMHRRTGSVLPPPADEFCSSLPVSASKLASKCPSIAKGSPPDVGGSRSAVLPPGASWGLRATSQPPSIKQKPEVPNNSSGPVVHATTSAWHDVTEKMNEERTTHLDGKCRLVESARSVSRDSKVGLPVSSVDIAGEGSSAWYDDDAAAKNFVDTSTRISGGSGVRDPSKFIGKDSFAALSNSSVENSFLEQTSAWYDDEFSDVNVPDKCNAVQFSSQFRGSDLSDQLASKDAQSSSLIDVVHAKETSSWDDDIVTTSTASEGNLLSIKHSLIQTSESCFTVGTHTSVQDLPVDNVASSASVSSTLIGHLANLAVHEEIDVGMSNLCIANCANSEDLVQLSHSMPANKTDNSHTFVKENPQDLSSQLSILKLDKHSGVSLANMDVHNSDSNGLSAFREVAPGLDHLNVDNGARNPSLASSGGDAIRLQDVPVSTSSSDWPLEPQRQSELGCGPFTDVTQSMYLPYSTESLFLVDGNTDARGVHAFVDNTQTSAVKIHETPHVSRSDSFYSNGHIGSTVGCLQEVGIGKKFLSHDVDPIRDKLNCIQRPSELAGMGKSACADTGESTIISNILTMDFDPWNESLLSAKTFAKLLNQADEQSSSLKMTNLWKGQNNQESRFSFARQESQASFSKRPFGEIAHAQINGPMAQDSMGHHVFQNGFNASSYDSHMAFNNSALSVTSADRSAALSRAKISAPPGFSAPNRLQAPPGFSSQERFDQAYDISNSDNLIRGGSSLGSDYQIPGPGNIADVEFIDPAILAVGKGRLPQVEDNSGFDLRYGIPSQFNTTEIDPRIQLLMQQSVSAHQDLRMSDNFGSRFLPQNDSYIHSRNMHENPSSLSSFGLVSLQSRNSQWGGWNNVHANNDVGLNELLRNKRLGLNRYFPGNEDKFPTGDIFSRGFGL